MAATEPKLEKPRFGIGEWYGNLFYRLTYDERVVLNEARKGGKATRPPCPFKKPNQDGTQPECTKKGGVCSLKLYEKGEDVDGIAKGVPVEGKRGTLRIMCPYRFHEGGQIFEEVGRTLLDDNSPTNIGEVGFLMPESKGSVNEDESEEEEELELDERGEGREDVGRIDSVLMRSDQADWCAVEVQAVYFSGSEMGAEFAKAVEYTGFGAHFPAKKRRPDYRSSGPKRLMPQLQIKVPTLRRWGKRMAVVVDEAFFSQLGKMDRVEHRTNADIAWLIVRLDEGEGSQARLVTASSCRFTTLERTVEGLTAGKPVILPEFEARIQAKIKRAEDERKKIYLKQERARLQAQKKAAKAAEEAAKREELERSNPLLPSATKVNRNVESETSSSDCQTGFDIPTNQTNHDL